MLQGRGRWRSPAGWPTAGFPRTGADWTTEQFRAGRPRIDAAAIAAGREPADVITVVNLGAPVLTDGDLPVTRGPDGRFAGGSARQWVEQLTVAVTDHGVTGFNVAVLDESGAIGTDVITRFGAEVIAPVRRAVG